MKAEVLILASDHLLDSFTDRMVARVDELLDVGRKLSDTDSFADCAAGTGPQSPADRPTGYIVHDFPAEVRR